jgi:hypothetical protein
MVIEERDSPWPRKGDHLFVDGHDWHNNAVLNGQRDNLSLYAVGYKRAGELLAEAAVEGRRDHDSLVFPIAYVYRQYLELRLKQLIRDSRRLLGDNSGFPATHKIAELWKLCRPLLDQTGLKTDEQVLEVIEELIAEFAEVDEDSYAFRYPTDKRNNLSLPDLRFVNLPNLADVIRKMSNFFEAVGWQLSVTLERETVPRLSTCNASYLDGHSARQQPREFEPQEEKDAGPLISG